MRGKMNLNKKKFILPLAIFIIYWFTILFFHLLSPTIPLTFTQSKLHTKTPPRIAYFITGSADNEGMMERILLSIYHPLNVYLLHLDTEATPMECRILFIDYTSHLSWKKEGERSGVVIIDRDLYTYGKGILQLPEKMVAPTVFDLFIGLSRSFIEYCIWGWDNLPRSVLMYHANSVTSSESYFQTVICNSPEFHNTTINTDLHFNTWDIPNDASGYMTMDDRYSLQKSNAPFARKFEEITSEHVLDWIDQSLLSRDSPDMFVPGGWCAGWEQLSPNRKAFSSGDPCLRVGNVTNLIPGYGVHRLRQFFNQLVYNRNVSSP